MGFDSLAINNKNSMLSRQRFLRYGKWLVLGHEIGAPEPLSMTIGCYSFSPLESKGRLDAKPPQQGRPYRAKAPSNRLQEILILTFPLMRRPLVNKIIHPSR